MATLSIIKVDNTVVVDGVDRTIDCSDLASNIWAVQFDGSNGHIEYNDGTGNEAITDVDAFQSKIDAHAALDDPTPLSEEDAFAALSYAEKRQQAGYASIGDQLDMQYHDSVNDTTTWKDHIAQVKTDYPK